MWKLSWGLQLARVFQLPRLNLKSLHLSVHLSACLEKILRISAPMYLAVIFHASSFLEPKDVAWEKQQGEASCPTDFTNWKHPCACCKHT